MLCAKVVKNEPICTNKNVYLLTIFVLLVDFVLKKRTFYLLFVPDGKIVPFQIILVVLAKLMKASPANVYKVHLHLTACQTFLTTLHDVLLATASRHVHL